MGHFPFGENWYNATNDKLFFTSYERDSESGNDYAQARYYINLLGRFSSPDPIAGSSAAPQSLNRYSYVGNIPTQFKDPSGLYPVCINNRIFDAVDYFVNDEYEGTDFYPTAELCSPRKREDGLDGGDGGGGGNGGTIKITVKLALCAEGLAGGLFSIASENGGAALVGYGGSGGIALPVGFTVSGSLQLAYFPDGTVALVASGGYNPGNLPGLALGGVVGAAFSQSTAQTPSQLEGTSFNVSAGFGPVQGQQSFSSSSMTTTLIVGAGIGGRGKGKLQSDYVVNGRFGNFSIPSAVQQSAGGGEIGRTKVLASFNCQDVAISGILKLLGTN